MSITAARRIQFAAGHRVYRHESKCRHLHGHNYVAIFTAIGIDSELDDRGRVIDFGVLKEKLGGWVDKYWDHGFIVYREDTEALKALELVGEQKLFVLDKNPTAENMADYLLKVVAPDVLHGTGVKLVEVKLWETENCFSEVRA